MSRGEEKSRLKKERIPFWCLGGKECVHAREVESGKRRRVFKTKMERGLGGGRGRRETGLIKARASQGQKVARLAETEREND